MTSITDRTIDEYRARFAGRLITSSDTDFDTARSVWNGDIDRRPAVIARCAGPSDVGEAIRFARDAGLEISVRGGAHNFGGAAVATDGMMIDLSGIRGVAVDPATMRAHCGGGATMADLDAATQEHGLAVPAGTISHTGVGGLTLGGGFGWLTNRHGLACDNVLSADVVTADGEVRHASADEHPDLYWAIRGGGGNFGVVTDFEFQLFPVGPMVQLSLFFWGLDQGVDAMRVARDVTTDLPRDLGSLLVGLNAPPAPFVPEQHHFAPGYALMVAGFGDPAVHAALVRRVRDLLPPAFDLVTDLPYVELQRMIDDSAPWGIRAYEKAVYLDSVTDDVISVVAEYLPRKASPMSIMPMFTLGGAFRDMPDDATAFGGSRSTGAILNMSACAPDPELLATDRAWVRDFYDAVIPHAQGAGGYVNFMTDYDGDRVRAAYGPAKYDRLAAIKAVYDPENVFHLNPNVKPARPMTRA
jgi:FAD/FMN-containing dehydrogenase